MISRVDSEVVMEGRERSSSEEAALMACQQPEDYESAISLAWADLAFDPAVTRLMAMSPSGHGCCACY